jgi:hypothetical protein
LPLVVATATFRPVARLATIVGYVLKLRTNSRSRLESGNEDKRLSPEDLTPPMCSSCSTGQPVCSAALPYRRARLPRFIKIPMSLQWAEYRITFPPLQQDLRRLVTFKIFKAGSHLIGRIPIPFSRVPVEK